VSEQDATVKAEAAAVRAILHGVWDPIGARVPEDEYDSYLWPVLALLRRKAPREALASYLRWAADERMAVSVPEERLERVLDMLLAVDLAA